MPSRSNSNWRRSQPLGVIAPIGSLISRLGTSGAGWPCSSPPRFSGRHLANHLHALHVLIVGAGQRGRR